MTQAADNTPNTASTEVEITPQAVYGPVVGGYTGQIPFTGWTSILAPGSLSGGSVAGTVQFNGITQHDAKLAHLLRTPGGRRLRRLMKALNGVAPGALAQESRARVQHQQGSPGGMQIVEQTYYINRNTTAADASMINAMLDRTVFTPVYPIDASGNGGGSKLQYKGIG